MKNFRPVEWDMNPNDVDNIVSTCVELQKDYTNCPPIKVLSGQNYFNCVYRMVSPIGSDYIGQTHDLIERHKKYKLSPKYFKSQKKLFGELGKYGYGQFYVEILQCDLPSDMLHIVETQFIEKYRCFFAGLNGLRIGGTSTGYKHTDQHKVHMSKRMFGNKNPMFGITLPPHIIEQATRKRVGQKRTKETCENIAQANRGERGYWFGKKQSEEHKRKARDAKVNVPKSEEHRLRISSALVGKVKSQQHRTNLSKSRRGKVKNISTVSIDENGIYQLTYPKQFGTPKSEHERNCLRLYKQIHNAKKWVQPLQSL